MPQVKAASRMPAAVSYKTASESRRPRGQSPVKRVKPKDNCEKTSGIEKVMDEALVSED